MKLDLDWIRWELLLAIGLVACGPDAEADDGEGSGDASTSEDGSSTQASSSVSETGSTTAPSTWPDPPWCGLDAPADARAPRPCDNPQEQTEDGAGWTLCSSGAQHRTAAV